MESSRTVVTETRGVGALARISWPAIVLAVVVGFGLTVLFVTIGAAAGAMADNEGEGDAGKIAAAVGTWTVLAALGGTFVGSYIGGRFTRWGSRGYAIYHAIAAWALSVLVGAWLGAIGATGLLGAGLNAAANRPGQAQAQAEGTSGAEAEAITEAIGWGGWALAAGMALSLLVSIVAWWIGSRRSLDDFETTAA